MRRTDSNFSLLLCLTITLFALWQTGICQGQETATPTKNAASEKAEADNTPTSLKEARARARMLHEAFHGALQVIHRDYFAEDEKQSLPVRSLEDVFEEMARRQHVKLRWIAVNTKAMSIDHQAVTEFEKAAVRALSLGKKEFESVEDDSYKYVGTVRLSAHCLKCHFPGRNNNDDRAAGLVITMPLKLHSTSTTNPKHQSRSSK